LTGGETPAALAAHGVEAADFSPSRL
jgi:hypothetical protein